MESFEFQWKRIFFVLVGVVLILLTTPVFAETGSDDNSTVEYIKGRPLTEQELAEQKSHEPKLENLNIEDITEDRYNSRGYYHSRFFGCY